MAAELSQALKMFIKNYLKSVGEINGDKDFIMEANEQGLMSNMFVRLIISRN